jgi:hypothetical protein
MLLNTIMAMKINVTGDTLIATCMLKLNGGMNDNAGTGLIHHNPNNRTTTTEQQQQPNNNNRTTTTTEQQQQQPNNNNNNNRTITASLITQCMCRNNSRNATKKQFNIPTTEPAHDSDTEQRHQELQP